MAPQRVLLVEDSGADAELVIELLAEERADATVQHVTSMRDALQLLASQEVDVAVADLSLPDASGLDAVRTLRAAAPDLPLVILTGVAGEATALDALAGGAQDYLSKEDLTPRLLARSLRYAQERMRADLALRTSARWTAAILDGLDAPTCAVDPLGRVVALNAAMHAGAALLPVTCFPGDDLLDPDHDAALLLLPGLNDVLLGRAPRFECECQSMDDRWWSLRVTPLPGSAGAVVMQVDITALKHAQQELTMAVLHDPLTGLPNRTLLHDRLEQAFAYAMHESHRVAVVSLDLDRFKAVNDTVGQAVGDLVLVAVGERLARAAGESETVARVSADEFVVVYLVDDHAHAEQVARELLAAVTSAAVVIDGRELHVTAAAGLAVAAEGETGDDVLRAAEEAMHSARARGGARLELASAELRGVLERRLEVEAALEAALADGRLEVHYQPVVRLADGVTTGAEALVRLRRRDGSLVAPADFIEVAEHSGQIFEVGRVVLDTACRDAAAWDGDLAGASVAVNLSTRQLGQPDVVDAVQASLRASGLAPSRLLLEVTESAVVEDAEAALSALQALKALGVRTAIDDFGTGYSSFLYLKQFPVDVLKIDRTFVAEMLDNPDDGAIVASIVRLGLDVGLCLIAEGVETEEQRRHLARLGCTEAQGYLFARPVPAAELPAAVALARREWAPTQRTASRRGEAAVAPEALARIQELSAQGASLHTIAAVLNGEGVAHPLGRRWHPRSVARCLEQFTVSARR